MRSVDEQLARVLGRRGAARAGPGGDLRGPGPVVRRGGRRRTGPARLRPGGRRRVRRAQRRRAVGGLGAGHPARRRGDPDRFAPAQAAAARPGGPGRHRRAAADPGRRGRADRTTPTATTRASPSKRPVPSAAFVRRTGEDVQPGDVAVRRGVDDRVGPGRTAGRGRQGQGAGAPAAAGVGDLGRRRAGRHRPHAGAGPGLRRELLRAGRRRAGRGRRGAPGSASCPATPNVCARWSRAGCCCPRSSSSPVASAAPAARRSTRRSSELGNIDVTRVAMHPGSVQGFGTARPRPRARRSCCPATR